ncbi:ATP-dependent Clp protease proteolytic subunit [Gordonia sp. (in: high G+C Gram-positive bacteria)]|uniref:ClpP family protease n=1 Tax=Gordonia sp. (in: high G+C Gram-positive bacteria) TaxID=84139 RepID=UPI001D1D4CD3|nr:ATP-dependent Clp protease proteolytic subunit [Gordonia sp. (in: high G+C Gram-positive bacteria)]MCB1293759.1 ATP-dependent Clp protease proteolytic subunit [Gordonia sp. (in: high G+C Gram-positive bacteria)]HMS74341.1 ATP-dependent Clp protease proteolytic subunit [Gordonia sp. (in: high G+C Gram-positive bacteria)]HQV18562.1 ATP-dependent Clp protease proteolytic subunit [Gordonia sp. (in: high G+C Gram-positive bacteria)]
MSDEKRTLPLSKATAESLLNQRILMLDSALDDEIGSQLCAQLVLLSAYDPTADIALWINSPGGSVPAMLAIADTMDLIPNDVATVNLGMAYSAGQFLLCCGAAGKRYALPHAKVLLHQGSAGIGGYAPDIELQADDLRHVRDTVLSLIAEKTGQPLDRIFDDSLRDHVFTASESVDYGFIDQIVTTVAQIRPSAPSATGFGVSR